jgi:hypothetical protein
MTDHRVAVPEGTSGSVEVRRFVVPERSTEHLRLSMRGRGCPPGEYTKLLRNGRLWMSDTPAEWYDHRAVGAATSCNSAAVRPGVLGDHTC